jgi:hypothetical protein
MADYYFVTGYIASTNLPAFADPVFGPMRPGSGQSKERFIAETDRRSRISQFRPLPAHFAHSELPEDHEGRKLFAKIGGAPPYLAAIDSRTILCARNFTALLEMVRQYEDGGDGRLNPIFALNVARYLQDEKLEIRSAARTYRLLATTLEGLNEVWLKNATLSKHAREYVEENKPSLLDGLDILDQATFRDETHVLIVDRRREFRLSARSLETPKGRISIHISPTPIRDIQEGAKYSYVVAPPDVYDIVSPHAAFGGAVLLGVTPLAINSAIKDRFRKRGIELFQYPADTGGTDLSAFLFDQLVDL